MVTALYNSRSRNTNSKMVHLKLHRSTRYGWSGGRIHWRQRGRGLELWEVPVRQHRWRPMDLLLGSNWMILRGKRRSLRSRMLGKCCTTPKMKEESSSRPCARTKEIPERPITRRRTTRTSGLSPISRMKALTTKKKWRGRPPPIWLPSRPTSTAVIVMWCRSNT